MYVTDYDGYEFRRGKSGELGGLGQEILQGGAKTRSALQQYVGGGKQVLYYRQGERHEVER